MTASSSFPDKKVVVTDESIRKSKRRVALATLVLPIIGTAVAVGSAFVTGIGWVEIGILALMFTWATLGLEVGFHRLFAHRAFRTSKLVEIFWWTSALMAGQGRGIYWIATHRRHHKYSDTPNDPHSPLYRLGADGGEQLSGIKGLWHAHQGNTYRDYATNVATFAADMLRVPLYRKLDTQFPFWVVFGLVFPAVLGGLAYGNWVGAWNGFLWGGAVRMFIQHQTFFTNGSLAHRYGEQLFDTGDNSRNNWYCAIWTFGSALQNTHHAFPSSAYLKQRWYELDIAGIAIRVMELLGIAKDVQKPSPTQLANKRLVKA